MKIDKLNQFEKIDPISCFRSQLNLESLGLDPDQRIIRIDSDYFDVEKGKDHKPPNIITIKFGDETRTYFSSGIDSGLLRQLKGIDRNDFFNKQKMIIVCLWFGFL